MGVSYYIYLKVKSTQRAFGECPFLKQVLGYSVLFQHSTSTVHVFHFVNSLIVQFLFSDGVEVVKYPKGRVQIAVIPFIQWDRKRQKP